VSEVRQSITELDEMGYLSVTRTSGKRSIYKPEFAARGSNNPTDNPSRKYTPPVGTGNCAEDPSSLPIGNSVPSIKRVKRVLSTLDFKTITIQEAYEIPSLKLYRKATDFFPGSLVWELVHNEITANSLTFEKIHAAAVAWEAKGFKRENVAGILEWARDGVPDFKVVRKPSSQPNKQAAKIDGVTAELEKIINGES